MRKRAFAVAGLGAAVAGLAWWWAVQPRTPEEYFKVRCGTCHKVPDLSRYRKDEMALIVRTMRERNGAAGVIDDEEAAIITRYLEGLRP